MLITDLLTLYTELAQRSTLAPAEDVNRLFHRLVALTATPDDELAAGVLGDPRVQAILHPLRALSAAGEYALEIHWAGRIIAHPQPHQELTRFTFYENYTDLMRLEYATLSSLNPRLRTALVVGAGPLPMTALLLSRDYRLATTIVDKDADALRLGAGVLQSLEPAPARAALCTDILDFTALAEYDFIHLAALAGVESETKARIIAHLWQWMRPGAFLLLRTAEGLRTLLYPPIALQSLAGFTLQVSVRPLNHIVNSFIIVQK
jgi:nicotianamine synthase